MLTKPKIGPIIRDKTFNSISIVIHGTKIRQYGYIRVFSDDYEVIQSVHFVKNKYYGQRLTFEGLNENTEYNYQVGISIRYKPNVKFTGKVYKFKTPSKDQYAFAFGSCRLFVNIFGLISIGDNISDRCFQSINKKNIDSVYIMGDHPYMDTIKELPMIRLKRRRSFFSNHIKARSTKGFKSIAMKHDIQEIPDDHEYRDNGTPDIGKTEPKVYRHAVDAINTFQIHSGPHEYGSDVKYWKYQDRGVCDIFICDTRYEINGHDMMSDEQLVSLQSHLLRKPDRKPFLLLSPVPFLLEQYGDDMWYSYPKQHTELINFIRNNDIKNVFVLTGDSHISATTDFYFYDTDTNFETGNKIVEIMSSSLFQIAHDSRKLIQNCMKLDDCYLQSKDDIDTLRKSVIRKNNFAVVDVKKDSLTVTYYKAKDGSLMNIKTYSYW